MQATAVNAQVLVLNKLWMAIRVVSAQRAFSMLYRDLAEAIDVDDAAYVGYDFETWAELGIERAKFDGDSSTGSGPSALISPCRRSFDSLATIAFHART